MYLWSHLLITDLLGLIQVSSSNVSMVSSINKRSMGSSSGSRSIGCVQVSVSNGSMGSFSGYISIGFDTG